jgi:glyoxylase-like metal-dependent hydrolase (beta-lactamase superfamily II)
MRARCVSSNAQDELNRHLPTEFVRDRVPFTVAGLRITPLVMGPSESPAAVVYLLPERRAAIAGDLVNVPTVAAPTISLARWLEQLDRIERETGPETILHVGHGPRGPARPLVAEQRGYLQLLKRLVGRAGAEIAPSVCNSRKECDQGRRHRSTPPA